MTEKAFLKNFIEYLMLMKANRWPRNEAYLDNAIHQWCDKHGQISDEHLVNLALSFGKVYGYK